MAGAFSENGLKEWGVGRKGQTEGSAAGMLNGIATWA